MAYEGPREDQPSLKAPTSSTALIGTIFSSRNEMESALNGLAAIQGYAFVVTRSKNTRRGLPQVYYKCDRGGTYKKIIISVTVSIMFL